jgi:hypothetical protein
MYLHFESIMCNNKNLNICMISIILNANMYVKYLRT